MWVYNLSRHHLSAVILVSAGVLLALLSGSVRGGERLEDESAGGYSLSSQPSKCISLNQGLVCYQTLEMHWQAVEVGDYCMMQAEALLPQKCWLQQSSGALQIEFAETKSQTFVLRRRGQSSTLASVQIEVKWVYKQRRKDRSKWRIF